jgi:TatD DNase family protein
LIGKLKVIFIDTHCHLDAQDFSAAVHTARALAATNNVAMCVIPAVEVGNFEAVRTLAHAGGDSYALGIHPLYVAQAGDDDLDRLDAALTRYRDDPRLVAVGEIGLDYFVPELCVGLLRERQENFFSAQLKLARKHRLPVLLHSRRSVDQVLKALRAVGRVAAGGSSGEPPGGWHGIAHAFNGSTQQAQALLDMGLKLGFGGAMTYPRALQLRRLAASLPLDAIVLETDAPDMPPRWLYQPAEQRVAGVPQTRNSPAELPRIGAELAALRGISIDTLAEATTRNALAALPRIRALMA